MRLGNKASWPLITLVAALCAIAWAGNAVFLGDDGQEFDLAELREGETRTFGSGERQLTATRSGDVVSVRREATGDRDELSFECRVTTDSCTVTTFDGDDRVIVKIEKERECINGLGDCAGIEDLMIIGAHGDGHHVIVDHDVVCKAEAGAEAEGCEHAVWVSRDGDEHEILIDALSGGGAPIIRFGGGVGKTVLRCPEGDTTMLVNAEEANDTFLCPKHSQPLELRKSPGKSVRKIRVIREAE